MEIIDVSAFQGAIDWHAVRKAGVTGAWLKATEGLTWDDKAFEANRKLANAAGIRVGAYHFARPDHNEAVAEANHFARVVGRLDRRDLKPALDFETYASGDLEAWAHKFSQQVKRRLGRYPVFYSYFGLIESMELRETIGNGLWLAAYGVNDGHEHPVRVPEPWKKYVAHQYTSKGKVAGVVGHVDRSYAPRLRGVLAYPIRGLL